MLKPNRETWKLNISAPRQKLKNSWQGISLYNALIIFFKASKLREEI